MEKALSHNDNDGSARNEEHNRAAVMHCLLKTETSRTLDASALMQAGAAASVLMATAPMRAVRYLRYCNLYAKI
jgi:hypothetical protein